MASPHRQAKTNARRNERFFSLLSETFKTLGDPSRLKIVWSLSKEEQSVGKICEQLNLTQPAVSHHLRVLRELRLVNVRKAGTTAYYSLDDEHIDRLLKEGTEHVEELMQ